MSKRFGSLVEDIDVDVITEIATDGQPSNVVEPVPEVDNTPRKNKVKIRKSCTISPDADKKLEDMMMKLYTTCKIDIKKINESRLIELAIMQWDVDADTADCFEQILKKDKRFK